MRKRVTSTLVICCIALAGIGAYFYVPKIFGDTVYPLQYSEIIKKYAAEYDVDPSFVAAVILQESRFNPNAVSPKGATGLMQIMPATGAGIAKNLGATKYSLKDPETSIRFGTFYLKSKLDKYNGDIDAVLAAYNAGSGNADRWIRLGILGNIPFSETNNYVKKVKNYQIVYETMYADELGITGNIELRQTTPEEEASKVRGAVWTEIFHSIFNLGA